MSILDEEEDPLEVLREAFVKEEEKADNPKITFKTEKTITVESREPSEYDWKRKLAKFKEFLNVVQGKVDIRRRLDAILNPEKIQTSTRLSGGEIDFVVDAYWLAKTYPDLFMPLKDFADELMYTKISEQGLGRQEAIQFMGAVEASKLFKTVFGTEIKVEPRRKAGILRRVKEE